MSTLIQALDAMKVLALTIDPSPNDSPVVAYRYPNSAILLDLSRLPAIVVRRYLGTPERWIKKSHGIGRHYWSIELLVFLAERDLPEAEAEEKSFYWEKAIADILFANFTLSDTITGIGDGGGEDVAEILPGHIHGFEEGEEKARAFWGIWCRVPVYQDHAQTIVA